LRALDELGIQPDIVCGCSIGALVGGFYVTDNLDTLEQWVLELDLAEIIRYLDIRLLVGGGFIDGKRLIDFFREEHFGDSQIESLPIQFGAIASNLENGQEVWLREGSILEAIRASIALPGIFTPVKQADHWLVDGGLVNPVPVSLCRAMGADKIIAVNLNSDIAGRHLRKNYKKPSTAERIDTEKTLLDRLSHDLKQRANNVITQFTDNNFNNPGLFNVMASSINIMQDRITSNRLAHDPPDVLLEPKLSHLGLLEFDRAKEAIEEGHRCTLAAKADLKALLS
jgi:NTE family protein